MNFFGGWAGGGLKGQLIKYCSRPGIDKIKIICKVNLKMFYPNSKEI